MKSLEMSFTGAWKTSNQMVSDQMVRVAKVRFGENGVPCSNSKAEDNRAEGTYV